MCRLSLYRKVSLRLADIWIEYARTSGEITDSQALSIWRMFHVKDMKISKIILENEGNNIENISKKLEEEAVVRERMEETLHLLIKEYTKEVN